MDEESDKTEPMTSVIAWTRYDGTPKTLPEEERIICLLGAKEGVARLFEGMWIDVWDTFFRHPKIGDLWSCLPEPPKADKQ